MEKLLSRVKNIIVSPRSEWQVIKAEQTAVKDIILSYVAVLAIIPAVASFIGLTVVGFSFMHTFTRYPVFISLLWGVFSYIFSIVAVMVSAAIINALAPAFESAKDYLKALKVVSYAYTPVWIAGVLNVVPALYWPMLIMSLYSIYLLYLGLSPIMGTPQNKALGYTVVSIMVIIAVEIVTGFLAAQIIL
jgi:hypothetical protein